jgi:hypothetical protein
MKRSRRQPILELTMKKVCRILVFVFSLLLIAYIALFAYAIPQQSIEFLLVCADSGGMKIPYSNKLCRSYLLAFRGTPKDIEALNQGFGAYVVIQGEGDIRAREEVLAFLVSKGLDLNRIRPDFGVRPLHASVLVNEPDEVQMLLRNGADASLRDERYNLTPLELAKKLQAEGKIAMDRSAVIALLQQDTKEATR